MSATLEAVLCPGEVDLAESLRYFLLGEEGQVLPRRPKCVDLVKQSFPQVWPHGLSFPLAPVPRPVLQEVLKMATEHATLYEVKEENQRLRAELSESQEELRKALEEIERLKVFHGQSPEVDLL